MEYITGIIIVSVVFFSVTAIVKMALEYNLKVEKIKHGYPLEGTSDEKIESAGYYKNN